MAHRDATYSIAHSLQRFEERYHKTITVDQYNILVKRVREAIKENKSVTAAKKISKSNIQYVVNIDFEGNEIIATYETERDTITTFLPNNPGKKYTNYNNRKL